MLALLATNYSDHYQPHPLLQWLVPIGVAVLCVAVVWYAQFRPVHRQIRAELKKMNIRHSVYFLNRGASKDSYNIMLRSRAGKQQEFCVRKRNCSWQIGLAPTDSALFVVLTAAMIDTMLDPNPRRPRRTPTAKS
jgi:hypothetical protein